MNPKKTVLIIGHGSRESSALNEFKRMVRQYGRRRPKWWIAYAFLEMAEPSIPQALGSLAKRTNEILILPLFLFAAGHMKRDIPRILKEFKMSHPKVRVKLAKELGPEPLMAELLMKRVGLKKRTFSQNQILVVGRGARELSAQKDFRKIVGILRKKGDFKKVQHCFFDVSRPSFEESLSTLAAQKPQKLLIAPYLLFKGSLVNRISKRTRLYSLQNPAIQVRLAPPLGIHPKLFQLMDQRLREL